MFRPFWHSRKEVGMMEIPVSAEEKTDYRYFAFISYSRKDIKWAKWLQKKLQDYRLPAKLVRVHKQLPKRIYPVFRDQQDISGNILQEALQEALRQSRYLIVICSPNSAASKYVNDEIRYFTKLGRQAQIIPLIVDGIAFSKEKEQECFPKALRMLSPEPLGINIQEYGKRGAFLRVVSCLLQIHHDEVIRRDGVRMAVRKAAAAVAGAALVVAGAGVLWDSIPHAKYYNAYTTCYEVPVGLYELTKEQRAVDSDYYRITTQRGRVIRLETVNSAGKVTNPAIKESFSDYPRQEFRTFDDRGRPIEIDLYDSQGQLALRKKLSYDDQTGQIIVDYQQPDSLWSAAVSTAVTDFWREENTLAESMVIRQVNNYNEQGQLLQSVFYGDTTGTPACDKQGIYGKAYTYTENGQIASITNLDHSGQPLDSEECGCMEVFEYNGSGAVNGAASYSAPEASQGALRYKKSYQEDPKTGNVTSVVYLDAAGSPMLYNDSYYQRYMEYDEAGHITGERYFDTQGQPTFYMGYHEVRWVYDENGNPISARCFDTDRNPMTVAGQHEIRMEYDKKGNRTLTAFFDTDRQPIMPNGYHKVRIAYDSNGNKTSRRFYGTDGQPMLYEGYHLIRSEYDDRGNMVSEHYYDTEEKATTQKIGYHCVRLEYDTGNKLISAAFFSVKGEAVASADGYHLLRYEYDGSGNVASIRYYDEQAQPMLWNGYHEQRRQYDGQGNMISVRHFDTEGKAVLPEGRHEIRSEHDSEGNCVAQSYYDPQGKPVASVNGYHRHGMEYDENGRLISQSYFDIKGKPVLCTEGFHCVGREYDGSGNEISRRYYGTDGEPVLYDGYHWLQKEYDSSGNLISIRWLGTQDQPILRNGFHEIRREYDGSGNVVSESYFGTDRQPILVDGYHKVKDKYDDRGNVVSQSTFGTAQEPVYALNGAHEARYQHSSSGKIAIEAYYDEQGKPMLCKDGYHEAQYVFDTDGNVIGYRLLDTEGKLMKEGSF